MIDLDHNAGAPLRPCARDAMLEALAAGGNASSIHGLGRGAKRRLEDARERIAAGCGVAVDRVVFTSGGTEANALALHGARTVAAAVEHPAVLVQSGVVSERLPVDRTGRVLIETIPTLAAAVGAEVVAVMAANNETGVVQPLAAVKAALPDGVRLHVDAVQAPGRLDLPTLASLADTLALSSHKVGGPPGIGALVLAGGVEPLPLLRGGGQERGRRGGTENVAAAAGFAAALAAATAGDEAGEAERVRGLRDRLETGLRARVPGLVVFGEAVERLPNTLSVALPGWPAERFVMALDLAGVAVSSGAACSSGKVSSSHVLEAMGVDDELRTGAVRFSLGWCTNIADVEGALDAVASVVQRRRAA